MGFCLSCLKSVFALPTDVDANEAFSQNQVESPLITEREPLITTQPQPQQNLSRSAIKGQRAKQPTAASQPTESTPLLSAEAEPIHEAVDPDAVTSPLQEAAVEPPGPTDTNRLADINLDPFIRYSQNMARKKDTEGSSLRPYWKAIHSMLKSDLLDTNFLDPEFINLQSLLTIAQNPNPDELIRYLCSVAEKHENLKIVIDQYLTPVLERDYSLLTKSTEPIIVRQEGLESGQFLVRDFFSALHVILLHVLPPERGLREYVSIFIMLQQLFARSLTFYKDRHTESDPLIIPNSLCLLAFVSSSTPPPQPLPVPNVVIGFSRVGDHQAEQQSIEEDQDGIPIPKEVNGGVLIDELAGSCVEAEMVGSADFTPREHVGGGAAVILVSLTLALMKAEVTPVRACPDCEHVMELLQRQSPTLVTLDIAPLRGS